MQASDVPDAGRSHALNTWCKGRRDIAGKKVDVFRVNVAQRVLDIRAVDADADIRRSLVASKHRARLRRLDERLTSIFGKATHLLEGSTTASD